MTEHPRALEQRLARNKQFQGLPDAAKVAVRIVNVVFDQAMGDAIGLDEIVTAITQGVDVNKHATVQSLVHHGIKFFAGRVKASGLQVDDLQARGRSFV